MRLPPAIVRVLAAARPAVPQGLVDATFDVLTSVTRAPVTVHPGLRRVLVVAPHPDDETIGCGGTVATWALTGADVHVLLATDGEATIGSPHPTAETARRRRSEAQAACAALGTHAPTTLGLPDGRLGDHLEVLAAAIRAAVRGAGAQAVLTPWALERHPDHRAGFRAAVAADLGRTVELWGYEAHTPLHPTHVLPLGDVALARKRAALAAHSTAGLAFPLETTLALQRWRSLAARGGHGHAEAFHAVPFDAREHLAGLAATAWR